MKITANQYAKSLYAATKEKSQAEIKVVVANLIKILVKNRQMKLCSNISQKFGEIWNRENEVVEAEIVSVKKLDEKNLKSIEKFIQNKYSAKKVILNNSIDEKIKGGIIIRVGDEVLDGSVAGQLIKLRNNIIN